MESSSPPILYRSWSGFPVTKMSYSLASDVDFCGAKTIFSRFEGLTSILDSAALKFGIATEETVVEHYIKNTVLEANFKSKWEKFREVPLKYSRNDSDWSTLNRAGIALMKEFVDVRDMFPIVKPEFGVVFPRDPNRLWFDNTRLEYIADMVSHTPDGDILIDIKTAGRSYPEKPETEGYAALDPQLLVGSLASGIRRVGFLVFVKTRIPKIQFHLGTVTIDSLEQIDNWLQDQYHRLLNRRLVRRAGFRYPDDHCLGCDYILKCLGRHEEAAKVLRIRESRETEGFMATLDELI
jgi:hypothetical protein